MHRLLRPRVSRWWPRSSAGLALDANSIEHLELVVVAVREGKARSVATVSLDRQATMYALR